MGDNNQMVNEQFWLLFLYLNPLCDSPDLYNSLFPAHILVALMNELA